jgi:hypothetical protein
MLLTAPATADKPRYFHLQAKDLQSSFVPGETDPTCGNNPCVGQGIEWGFSDPSALGKLKKNERHRRVRAAEQAALQTSRAVAAWDGQDM